MKIFIFIQNNIIYILKFMYDILKKIINNKFIKSIINLLFKSYTTIFISIDNILRFIYYVYKKIKYNKFIIIINNFLFKLFIKIVNFISVICFNKSTEKIIIEIKEFFEDITNLIIDYIFFCKQKIKSKINYFVTYFLKNFVLDTNLYLSIVKFYNLNNLIIFERLIQVFFILTLFHIIHAFNLYYFKQVLEDDEVV
jgi:hypothetical protein